jgi:hypothetical protein
VTVQWFTHSSNDINFSCKTQNWKLNFFSYSRGLI